MKIQSVQLKTFFYRISIASALLVSLAASPLTARSIQVGFGIESLRYNSDIQGLNLHSGGGPKNSSIKVNSPADYNAPYKGFPLSLHFRYFSAFNNSIGHMVRLEHRDAGTNRSQSSFVMLDTGNPNYGIEGLNSSLRQVDQRAEYGLSLFAIPDRLTITPYIGRRVHSGTMEAGSHTISAGSTGNTPNSDFRGFETLNYTIDTSAAGTYMGLEVRFEASSDWAIVGGVTSIPRLSGRIASSSDLLRLHSEPDQLISTGMGRIEGGYHLSGYEQYITIAYTPKPRYTLEFGTRNEELKSDYPGGLIYSAYDLVISESQTTPPPVAALLIDQSDRTRYETSYFIKLSVNFDFDS